MTDHRKENKEQQKEDIPKTEDWLIVWLAVIYLIREQRLKQTENSIPPEIESELFKLGDTLVSFIIKSTPHTENNIINLKKINEITTKINQLLKKIHSTLSDLDTD